MIKLTDKTYPISENELIKVSKENSWTVGDVLSAYTHANKFSLIFEILRNRGDILRWANHCMCSESDIEKSIYNSYNDLANLKVFSNRHNINVKCIITLQDGKALFMYIDVNNKLERNLECRVRKLEKKLFEGKQVGTLYHVCTLKDYLKYILPTNTLKASGKYVNWLYKGTDYISFTRDKYFVVNTTNISNADILIQLVIDGDKLSNNYKIGPYNDYTYDLDGNLIDDSDLIKYREKEEVVKGPIKNISKYIKEVRLDIKVLNYKVLDQLKDNNVLYNNIIYYNFIKDKNKLLTDIIRNNNLNGVDIEDFISVTESYLDYRASMAKMIFSKDFNTVKQAIQSGADIDSIYGEYGTPLYYYCGIRGSENIIKLLSQHVKNLDAKSILGRSAIFNAVKINNTAAIKILLDAGANIEARDNNLDTPLLYAARLGNITSIKFLLDYGADINAKNNRNAATLDIIGKYKNIMNSINQYLL